jgi:hypothetical protein
MNRDARTDEGAAEGDVCPACGETIPLLREARHRRGLDKRALDCPLQDLQAILARERQPLPTADWALTVQW